MLKAREAAKLAGVSKATIHRARSEGRLSGEKDDRGHFVFDPAEVMRVFPRHSETVSQVSHDALRDTSIEAGETLKNATELAVLQTKLDAATKSLEERERELHHRDRTIDDLRSRLDTEGEERRKLTAMLTDQRPKGLWARIRGR